MGIDVELMAVTQLPEFRIFGTRWMDYEFFNTRTTNDNINYIEKPKKKYFNGTLVPQWCVFFKKLQNFIFYFFFIS